MTIGREPLGPVIHSFFVDHLVTVKGLRPASVRSYRDTVRLFLRFVSSDSRRKITRLSLDDLTFDRVVGFLRYLERERANHIPTRNQRLAAVHCLFEYIGGRAPEMLGVCQRVASIPMKRVAPPETHFLERDEVEDLMHHLPRGGRLALRDRALLLFLYNTGARVQEVADLRVEHLELGEHPRVRLHGKGDKWRTSPLWQKTATLLASLIGSYEPPAGPGTPVFSAHGQPLTRFGIYKIVRRHGTYLDYYSPPGHSPSLPAHGCGPPRGSRRRGQRHPRLARPRRSLHHEPLRRNQHQGQGGGPPCGGTSGFFGGVPHDAGLEVGRVAAQMARIALNVM